VFIILGIVIVVGIVILLFFLGEVGVDSAVELGPKVFVGKCVRDAVEESVEKILIGGGEIVPSQSILYQGEKWNYLCYHADYFLSCYNLYPMLEKRIEEEIRLDTMDEVQDCFDAVAIDFENSGFDVSGGATNYSIDLLPGKVDINLKKSIEVVREGAVERFEDFDSSFLSSVYNLVGVARTVVNAEAQNCFFEYNSYMLMYPEYDVRRTDYFGSKIYRLVDRVTGDEFRFAVRTCATEKVPSVEVVE